MTINIVGADGARFCGGRVMRFVLDSMGGLKNVEIEFVDSWTCSAVKYYVMVLESYCYIL